MSSKRTGHHPRNITSGGTCYTRRELLRLAKRERRKRPVDYGAPEVSGLDLFGDAELAATHRYIAETRARAIGGFARPGPQA